jgi:hypothetical protein
MLWSSARWCICSPTDKQWATAACTAARSYISAAAHKSRRFARRRATYACQAPQARRQRLRLCQPAATLLAALHAIVYNIKRNCAYVMAVKVEMNVDGWEP